MMSQLVQETVEEQAALALTEGEREALIVMTLITNIEYVSLHHLLDIVEVSKTSIMDDIKRTDALLRNYSLTIQ
ncbi:BglG family transcription antiterminator, partial [Enterococcus faecalis]